MQSTADRRVSLFGVEIDALTIDEATTRLLEWAHEPFQKCRYVVTPNVDHTVMLRHDPKFRNAYRAADLVVADGWPVVWASRLLGRPLPGLAPGSDLTPAVFEQHSGPEQLRVFLLGAMPGVAVRAAENIQRRWPQVNVVDVDSPPLGFEYREEESWRLIDKISAAAPDLLVVGLGAPKQEMWLHRHRRSIRAKLALCVGATIDFLAGEKHRAPPWMRRVGLEWMHRMASDPKRLTRRYLRDAREFPAMVLEEWMRTRRTVGLDGVAPTSQAADRSTPCSR